jgi:hypothetical protein
VAGGVQLDEGIAMARGLIGYSGLVGSNLLNQADFDDLYRSTNIESLAGRRFELLVCAGMPAEKWRANQQPEVDRACLRRLQQALAAVRAQRVVLISTVDVFGSPRGVDEQSVVSTARLHPYGLHRYELERWVSERFETLVVRLPGLFGPGLKKNVIYDLMHGKSLHGVHALSRYQFYNLERLWGDIERAQQAGLSLVHLATEPVSVAEVARVGFGSQFLDQPSGVEPAEYDFRSVHAPLWGGADGYLLAAAEVLEQIRRFVQSQAAVEMVR